MQLPKGIVYLISIIAFGGVYYLSGEVGLSINTGFEGVTPIWPPSGVALFVLLRYGVRYWPGIVIGIVLLAMVREISFITAVAAIIAQVLEGTLAWQYLRRFQVSHEFDTRRQVLWFIAIISVAALSSAILGAMGMVAGNMTPPSELGLVLMMWWLGDAIGMLVITPFLLLVPRFVKQPWTRRQVIEAIVVYGGLVMVASYSFGLFQVTSEVAPLMAYTIVPLVVWAAACFKQAGAVTASLFVSAILFSAAHPGVGPFESTGGITAVLLGILFVAVISATALFVAALFHEREHAESLLKLANEKLEETVARRPAALELAKTTAEQANAGKDIFLASMSHEIRTPMHGVIGFSKLLNETELTPKQQEYLAAINTSSANLNRIIDDILDFSKFQTGQFETESIPFSLDDVVDTTVALIRPQAYEKGLELVYGISEDTFIYREGDPLRISQILSNLIENAVKFTIEGTVSLWVANVASGDKRSVRFEIEDTGIGIPSERMEGLFDPFMQADVSITRKYGGSGLGLAICKSLVEAMGGCIEVKSQAGKGTVFAFELPLNIQSMGNAKEVGSGALIGKRALLLEQNPLALRAIRHTMLRLGLEAETIITPKPIETIRETGSSEYDLLLVGDNSVSEDGSKMAQLRELANAYSCKVILLLNEILDQPETDSNVHEDIACLSKASGIRYLKRYVSQMLKGTPVVSTATCQKESQAPYKIPNFKGLRMLVVDDNEVGLAFVSELLKSRGIDVFTARSGEEALRVVEDNRFDLVLMDIQMPGISGIEATRLLRSRHHEGQELPVIAVTANAYPEEKVHLLSAGLNDCITKPFERHDLWRLIRKWTKRVDTARENEVSMESPDCQENSTRDISGSEDSKRHLPPEIRCKFFESLPGHRELIANAFAFLNMESLRDEAHSLGGAAAYFGADRLKDAAGALERAAGVRDRSMVEASFKQIDNLLLEMIKQRENANTGTKADNQPCICCQPKE